MELMFSSNNKKFLDLYEPNIIFLDDYYIAEEEYTTAWFLEENNITKEEIKDLGLKIMKNKITIPKGTKAIVKNIENGEVTLKIGHLVFNTIVTYDGDFCMVDAVAKDKEFEKIISGLRNKVPKEKDNIMLYNYNVCTILDAIEKEYGFSNKRHCIEKLKCLDKSDIESIVKRLF